MSSAPTPFLHLKFTSLRPPPQYGHQLPFSHQLDPAFHELPDSLKTDVQREGIKRYLLQNFKEGSFVWEVVKERLESEEEKGEGKDSDGMYLVVNRSWARTVGDNKLHLSLYVYQEDKHCATWHAYTDRTISYSREGDATSADAPQHDPDAEANDQEELEEEFSPIPNEDPYSPPSALAQYVATMDSQSRPSSPFVPPERDSERPRFDRPYKEPVIDSDEEQEAEQAKEKDRKKDRGHEEKDGSETEEVHKPVVKDRRSRSSRKPKEEVQSQRSESPEEVVEKPQERRSRSARREKTPAVESESEEEVKEKSKSKKRDESDSEEEKKSRSKPDYPIIKSKPIGHQSSRKQKEEDSSVSRSRSPTPPVPEPVKSRSSRSKKREPSPQSTSRSPSPPRQRKPKEQSPSSSPSPIAEAEQERGRSRRSEKKPLPSASPSRSPSPAPDPRSTRSKPSSASPVASSRSPSPPPPVKNRSSRRAKSETPSRSPSPPPAVQPERSRSKVRSGEHKVEENVKKEIKKVEDNVRKMSTSRSRSRSRSPSPLPRHGRSRIKKEVEEEKGKVKKVVGKVREKSRSPSPKPTRSRHSRRKSPSPSRSRSPSPPPKSRHSRRKSVSHPADLEQAHPQGIHRSTATPSAEPTWRSVSRNRHRRADDSGDDTLVRGNMDDHELDIPAGGESTLLKAKPKKRSGHHHATKDEAFDPDEVERSRVQREKEKVVEPQTLKSAVGGWFKSVGNLIAAEAKTVVGAAEEQVLKAEVGLEEWEEKEREERRKRKAERAKRREERRKRKEAMEEGKREKAEELESMVDRAEDAAEGMLETSEKLTARKTREARKEKERRKANETNVSEEEEEPIRTRRHRSHRKAEEQEKEEQIPISSTRSRSKHRTSRPTSPVIDEEKPRSRSHATGEEEDSKSTRSSHLHRSRRDQSPSDHEEEPASPPPRPALRQRAMSISASVDAGIKGLRESVNKIVSSAGQVEHEKDDSEEGREARKAEREKRKIEKERKAIEEERKNIQAEEVERKKRLEVDSDEEDRMKERARLPRINTARKHDHEESQRSSRRSRHPRPSTPPPDLEPPKPSHQLPPSPLQLPSDSEFSEAPPPRSNRSSRRKPAVTSDEESEAPSRIPRSSRLDRQTTSRPPVFDPEESEASIAPIPLRQRQAPPPRPRSNSVTSDTDMSDAPSRASSRSIRSMDRSESEADTPVHLEAKRNARRNSTTIPIETIRSLREQQLNTGTRSIPNSPVTHKSRQDFPARTHQVKEELHRTTSKLAEDARKEKDHFVEEVHNHRKSRHHTVDTSDDENYRLDASRKHATRKDSSDDDRFDFTSSRSKPSLAPPSVPAYPRRLSPVPLSATSPISPYSYSPTDPPLRPQPIKPSSYRAPPHSKTNSTRSNPPPSARAYTPYSSDESSDEADPSRPSSARKRRGYRSGASIGSERSRRTQESPSSSYRFPSSNAYESESDGGGLGYPRSNRKEEASTHKRVQSFTRTQDALPFSSDEEQDDEAFEPVPQAQRYASYEDSEPDSYQALSTTTSGRSRTMVSTPKSVSSSHRSRGIPPPPPTTTLDNDYGLPSSNSSRIDPYSSSSYSPYTGTPSIRSPVSEMHGFTGFDARTTSSSHSNSLGKGGERREMKGTERERERKGVGKSSVPFGRFEAPVGRRMARRLQGEM